jgi:hypothetical protein
LIDKIRKQIKASEVQITKIKEKAFKKEVFVEKEIAGEFNPQIINLKMELTNRSNIIQKYDDKIKEYEKKKKEEKKSFKFLKNELTKLSKKRTNILTKKLNDINEEKTKEINMIIKKIKVLKKNLNMLEAKKFAEKWKRWASFKKEK